MYQLFQRLLLGLSLAAVCVILAVPASATVQMFVLHDHPNGDMVPPTYGLRIDELLDLNAQYTFSFDYSDINGTANVLLVYNDVAGTVHIYGRAYGGKDIGSSWSVSQRGWINIDFLFTVNVTESDNCPGAPGNDIYVTNQDVANAGTVELDGWGGSGTYNFTDKEAVTGCSFIFDNDWDSKGNGTISSDPSVWSGSGWLMPMSPHGGARDWLFIGEMLTVPTENTTWGGVKDLYSN